MRMQLIWQSATLPRWRQRVRASSSAPEKENHCKSGGFSLRKIWVKQQSALDFLLQLLYNNPRKYMESCPSWSKEHDWKSCKSLKRLRGFESLALRQKMIPVPLGIGIIFSLKSKVRDSNKEGAKRKKRLRGSLFADGATSGARRQCGTKSLALMPTGTDRT